MLRSRWHQMTPRAPGGRFYAVWDDQALFTRYGQLMFFFQFLHFGGRWEEFLRDSPLQYTGNRGSGSPNVMGSRHAQRRQCPRSFPRFLQIWSC